MELSTILSHNLSIAVEMVFGDRPVKGGLKRLLIRSWRREKNNACHYWHVPIIYLINALVSI
ncbi:MAG: hypothetical protein ABH832_02620 [bacterium]